MEWIKDIIAMIPILILIAAVGLLIRAYLVFQKAKKANEKYLQNQLDDARKDLDEAKTSLKYFGSIHKENSTNNKDVQHSNNSINKKRVFISTPVRGFNDEDFSDFVEEVSRMIDGMKATREFDDIFYENYRFASKEIFNAKKLQINEYFFELERSDVFIAIVPMPSLTSVYFEAGYAVALGKPSIYFIPEGAGKVVPSLMGEINRLKDYVEIVRFDSLDHIQRVLIAEYGRNSNLKI